MPFRYFAGLVLGACLLEAAACSSSPLSSQPRSSIQPVYDEQTGKLQLLKSDRNHDGRVDTWTHMDGSRIVRIEIDQDEDGTLDRWEYYGTDQQLEKVGSSRIGDGKPDTWLRLPPGEPLARLEISANRDGKISRTEYYDGDALVRADEDTDDDGKPDKWETYEGGRLAVVAFDTRRQGTPDRRFLYAADGSARLEASDDRGNFVPINPASSPR